METALLTYWSLNTAYFRSFEVEKTPFLTYATYIVFFETEQKVTVLEFEEVKAVIV
jgi:hypothetical protein